MTSKLQNRPIPIPQPALLISIVILLFVGGHVFGASPFSDTFDTYEIGNLAGQGDWATTSPPYFYAQTTTTDSVSAPISIYWTSAEDSSISKTGLQIAQGQWSFWLKVNSDTGTHYEWTNLILKGVSMATYLRLECWDTGEPSDCRASDTIFVKRPTPLRTTFCEMPLDEWVAFQVEWDNTDNSVRWKCGENAWTDYDTNTAFDYVEKFEIGTSDDIGKLEFYLDSLSPSLYSSIEITSPLDETSKAQDFDLEGDFNIKDEDWDRIMIIFEQWHASSTCPKYPSEEWETEYSNGWFITQSMPFFSNFITTTTGSFSIPINDLRLGTYNCTRCYFINETDSTISDEKCQGYGLTITADISPPTAEFYYPFLNWQSYYATSSEEFATSTPLFENMANALTPIVNKMGDFILYAKDYFDSTEAMAKGNELGQAIPKARGYLEMIDDFIGLPLSSFVIFYFLTMAVVISYKVILTIIKLLKP